MSKQMTVDEFYQQLQKARPSSFGTCRFCKRWQLQMYRYAIRHYICEECRIDKMKAYELARGDNGV
jgi:hypothetical protein